MKECHKKTVLKRNTRLCRSLLVIFLAGGILSLAKAQAQPPVQAQTQAQTATPSLLTLEQARQIARSCNRDLQTLRLNLQIAQEKTQEARSKAWPQLTSSANYITHDKPMAPDGDQHYSDAHVTLEQTLFHLGIWAGIRAAKQYQKVEELAARRYEETLDFLITEAYLGILRGQKEISVLKELEKNTQDHLRDTQNFYDEGMVPKTDLLKTELALSQVQRDLLAAENQQRKSWTIFKILLGVDTEQPYQLQDVELPPYSQKALSELQQTALSRRKDRQRLLADRAYWENILKAYQSRRYPMISASGSWDYTTDDKAYQEQSMTGGIHITLPLFTGFSISAQVAQGRSQLTMNRIQFRKLEDQIRQEVESAYLDIQKSRQNLETAQKEVAQAEENLRITNELYKESMATNTEVLDAQTLLAQARNHLNNARYDQVLAVRSLSLATGD